MLVDAGGTVPAVHLVFEGWSKLRRIGLVVSLLTLPSMAAALRRMPRSEDA
jgi:hypothetical protein